MIDSSGKLPHPLFETTDTFQQLIDHLNAYGDSVDANLLWLDSSIGDRNFLTTERKDQIVNAINEIDSDIYGAGGGNFATQTLSREKTILGAINSIFDVFDPDSAGFHFDSESFNLVVSGHGQSLSLISDSDINIIAAYDGNGGDVRINVDDRFIIGSLGTERVKYTFDSLGGKNLNTLYSNGIYEMHSKDSVLVRSDANAFTFNNVVDWKLLAGQVNSTIYGDLNQNIEGEYAINFTDGAVDNTMSVTRSTGENVQFTLTPTEHRLSSTQDFTIESPILNLDATANIIDMQVASVSRIKYSLGSTNTVTVNGNYIVDVNGDITLDASTGSLSLKDDGVDAIVYSLDPAGTNTETVTGNYVLDVSGDITLDADGNDIIFKDGTTERFRFNADTVPNITMTGTAASITNTAGDFTINAYESLVLNTNNGSKSWDIDNDTITHTGDVILDASGDITLDADGNNIIFKDGNTTRLQFELGSTSTLDVTDDLVIDAAGSITLNTTRLNQKTDAIRLISAATNDVWGGFTNENGYMAIRSNDDSEFMRLVTEGTNQRVLRVNGSVEMPSRPTDGSLSLEFDAINSRKLHDVLEALNRKIPRVYDRNGNLLNTLI